ncbi:hypothetical protein SAY87_002931 [Trapa incisa]|uniref:Uncharacterized protein n=1 Tax=Trapa incisa TaxID=236973 RepID=A0AAN7KJQ7_9MYRT|nr:hypothetical protein SAY87_002931 [Trapa incisa]
MIVCAAPWTLLQLTPLRSLKRMSGVLFSPPSLILWNRIRCEEIFEFGCLKWLEIDRSCLELLKFLCKTSKIQILISKREVQILTLTDIERLATESTCLNSLSLPA